MWLCRKSKVRLVNEAVSGCEQWDQFIVETSVRESGNDSMRRHRARVCARQVHPPHLPRPMLTQAPSRSLQTLCAQQPKPASIRHSRGSPLLCQPAAGATQAVSALSAGRGARGGKACATACIIAVQVDLCAEHCGRFFSVAWALCFTMVQWYRVAASRDTRLLVCVASPCARTENYRLHSKVLSRFTVFCARFKQSKCGGSAESLSNIHGWTGIERSGGTVRATPCGWGPGGSAVLAAVDCLHSSHV